MCSISVFWGHFSSPAHFVLMPTVEFRSFIPALKAQNTTNLSNYLETFSKFKIFLTFKGGFNQIQQNIKIQAENQLSTS